MKLKYNRNRKNTRTNKLQEGRKGTCASLRLMDAEVTYGYDNDSDKKEKEKYEKKQKRGGGRGAKGSAQNVHR